MYVFQKCIFYGADLILSTGVTNYMTVNSRFNEEALKAMNRFYSQDWGEVSEKEAKENAVRVEYFMDQIKGIYDTCKGKIVIYAWGVSDDGMYAPKRYEIVEVMLYKELLQYDEGD